MPNLVLVHWPERQSIDDLRCLAERVRALDGRIHTFVAQTKRRTPWLAAAAALRPTLGVSFMPPRRFRLLRGRMCHGVDLPKSVQYARYRKAGVPVPDWCVVGPGTRLDPAEWGEYVVVKPDLARKGAEVRIKRARRVTHDAGRDGALLAQRFVYTGRWANHTRVTTLFGVPLFQIHVELSHDFRPLEGRFAFKGANGVGGAPIVSNKRSSAYRLTADAEMNKLASRAHAAFPEIPLLGHDIVRDAETGELALLESNTRGDVWLFSSGVGQDLQAAHGLDLYGQFGGLDRAAQALVDRVHAEFSGRAARMTTVASEAS